MIKKDNWDDYQFKMNMLVASVAAVGLLIMFIKCCNL